ncbi:GNAT family N-acetyltransferase [Clostridium sartagoforme]|uniref:GNAT family N-acetyltransferase n=1 Tax=Clostridium sartagoforme TaxID=84031 RepID=A0A4S2DQT7_9CLOT|nr:GNAT family N-acetyltransferase [Clostridium sartagoforme]TGY43514.1 GNAT family N-acetyltransferase [Clostridium sartagoforme]
MNLKFKNIDSYNYNEAINLKVKESQEGFIETVSECLGEAKELSLWRPVGIYDNNEIIGFAMYGLWKNEDSLGRVWLDRFMIGENFQGNGYGKVSLKSIINKIAKEYKCSEIYLSIYENNTVAIDLYKKFGFEFNGELDRNGELVMKLEV